MNDRIGSSSERVATGLLRRAVAALAIATGLLLVAPAVTAGAQTGDDETTTTVADGDETTTTLEGGDDETTTTVEGGDDETTTTVEGGEAEEATTTTVPLSFTITDEEAPHIRVEVNHKEKQDPCSGTPALVMRHAAGSEVPFDETSDEEQTFKVKIILDAPLCSPIKASAVIYSMPGNGEAWPQTLAEKLDFTVDKAGTYEVFFIKTCEPAQFDVITGETPDVIAPLGEWHGPLLFPLDPDSSLQHWGCAEVAGTTTVAPEAGPATEALAFTGATSTPAALLGAVLLVAGAAFLLVARRRED